MADELIRDALNLLASIQGERALYTIPNYHFAKVELQVPARKPPDVRASLEILMAIKYENLFEHKLIDVFLFDTAIDQYNLLDETAALAEIRNARNYDLRSISTTYVVVKPSATGLEFLEQHLEEDKE